MTTNSSVKTFTINYGFLGGHSLGRRLRKLLKQKGYRFQPPDRPSDIVIAHSAGCFTIPEIISPKLTFFIGMPIGRDTTRQTYLQANRSNILHSVRSHHAFQILHILTAGAYYGLRQPKRNVTLVRHFKSAQPALVKHSSYIYIANQDDPWQKAAKLAKYTQKYDWTFISLPGSHDDIWDHPERYVAIIDHYARLLGPTDR